jgi:hypothetical protein
VVALTKTAGRASTDGAVRITHRAGTSHCNLKVKFRCRFAADSAVAELAVNLLLQLAATLGAGACVNG